MGSEIPFTGKRAITARINAWDWLDRVEVLKNNRVIHREYPVDNKTPSHLWKEPVLIRLEYGWGAMAANQTPQDRVHPIHDWEANVSFETSKVLDVEPCWQEGPFDEDRRHRILNKTSHGFHLQSYTSRRRAFEQRDTHVVALRVQGSPGDSITIELRKPEEKIIRVKLSDVFKGDHNTRTRGGSLKIHRIIPECNAKTSFMITDESPGDKVDWYYLRAAQKNGQLAWSSPIWVEKRG